MNEKENQKIDELSQRLEAIDQQEAQNHPMTGTRRWFFRALTFGIGGAVLGKSFIAEASSTCGIENETCVYDECTIDSCWEGNYCNSINNCTSSNHCIEINSCNQNICSKDNLCGVHNTCLKTNTCKISDK